MASLVCAKPSAVSAQAQGPARYLVMPSAKRYIGWTPAR
jgi:hypothetical protein